MAKYLNPNYRQLSDKRPNESIDAEVRAVMAKYLNPNYRQLSDKRPNE